MPKTTWADLAPGDLVDLNGRTYTVVKIKAKGKTAKVRVKRGNERHDAEVKLKDRVKRVEAPPLRQRVGASGSAQARWAKPEEAKAKGLGPGDAAVTKPPAKTYGDPWETPRDRVERKLDAILGAHLVGEASDERAGYYVPPVGVTTVAAHLALFHGVDPSDYGIDDMLDMHETQHKAALNGVALPVNHWHTKTRPETH